MTGSTAVIVLSVKSCCLPRTTIRKPTEYPVLSMRLVQLAFGRCALSIDWAKSEKLIDRPAASPDHQREVTGHLFVAVPASLRRRAGA
jgi:hypothetical protein